MEFLSEISPEHHKFLSFLEKEILRVFNNVPFFDITIMEAFKEELHSTEQS